MIWELAFAIPFCLFLCLVVTMITGWAGISIDININHTIRHEDDLDE